jgi:hypothetical protein
MEFLVGVTLGLLVTFFVTVAFCLYALGFLFTLALQAIDLLLGFFD